MCPIFGIKVCLNLGEIRPMKVFGAEYIPLKDSIAESTVIKNKDEVEIAYSVWIKNKTDCYSMVHETIHLVKNIFDKKGILFNSENHELIAYYQGYWVRKFWDKMSNFIK